MLASNGMDSTLRIWDVRPYVGTGERQVSCLYGHSYNFEKNLIKCGWSKDDRYVACGSSDRLAYVWNSITGQLVCRLGGHQGSVNDIKFSPI